MPTSYKEFINECIDQVTGEQKPITESTENANVPITPLAQNCKTQNKQEHYSELSMLVEDSDETESLPEEDPNDPEFEPTPAKRIHKSS